MRESFKEAMGEEFINRGGREHLATATVEDCLSEDSLAQFQIRMAASLVVAKESNVDQLIQDAFRKALKEASVSPVGANSKPRMLKLTAWIAHAGKPNRNRDAFTEGDLKAAVEGGMFAAPYFGMVDYNHDFNLYGVWYSAKYAYDPTAEAFGIIAEGAIFAWRYEELADKMLAMQSRLGHIDVSMACLPTDVEFAEDEAGTYAILRNPVFFTTSVLDVDPADVNARGLGTENTEQSPEERERELTLSSLSSDLNVEFAHSNTNLEEDMDHEKLIEAFREVVAEENREKLQPLVEAATRLPEVEAELEETKAALATANTAFEMLNSELTETKSALEETRLAAEAAKNEMTSVTEELEALRSFKAEIETAKAEEARAELRAARLAQLPEAAKQAFEAKDEETREVLLTAWESKSDAEWEITIASLSVLEPKGRYEAASEEEGELTPGSGERKPKGKFAIDEFIK